jgi:hypothetical protein
MEINTNPRDTSNLKLVDPAAAKRFQEFRRKYWRLPPEERDKWAEEYREQRSRERRERKAASAETRATTK